VPKLTKKEGGKEAKQSSEKKMKKGSIVRAEKATKKGTTMVVDSEDTSVVEATTKKGKKRTRAFRL
jgi:hypothetical protein